MKIFCAYVAGWSANSANKYCSRPSVKQSKAGLDEILKDTDRIEAQRTGDMAELDEIETVLAALVV
jgi:hypothetical protein